MQPYLFRISTQTDPIMLNDLHSIDALYYILLMLYITNSYFTKLNINHDEDACMKYVI